MQRVVDLQARRCGSGRAGCWLGCVALRGAAEQHFDARQQIVDVEGFGDEVIGAELEAQEGVAPALRAATDKDGHARGVLEHAAQDQAVFVRQDQVENDQVGLCAARPGSRGGASPGDADARSRWTRGRR